MTFFKKYIEKGLFDEFGVDILISRLNSGIEIRTIDDLVLLYADLLNEVLKELDPNAKELLFYEIKLLLEQKMATGVQVMHKDFEEKRFELKDRADRIVLEAKCKSCNSYYVTDSDTIYYLRKRNFAPYTPVPKSECSNPKCHKRSLVLPRL